MEKKKIEKITENMSFQTYDTIRKVTCCLPLGILVTDMTLQIPEYHIPFIALSFLSTIGCLYMGTQHGENYTIESKNLQALYHEFLLEYQKLQKTFEITSPQEMYAMYIYLYKNGYLSYNKKFTFEPKIKDNKGTATFGCYVLSGQGVCRHIATLLSDIMKTEGMDATTLAVHHGDYFVHKKELKKAKYTEEELFDWIHTNIPDEERQEFEIGNIKRMGENPKIELSILNDLELSPITYLTGNHAITFVDHNGISYFLDPTQRTTYRLGKDNHLYDFNTRLNIANKAFSKNIAFDTEEFNRVYDKIQLHHPSLSRKEEELVADSITDRLLENKDILEQFYDEHKEIYEEVADKVKILKK